VIPRQSRISQSLVEYGLIVSGHAVTGYCYGGSDAFIVCDDANIPKAVEARIKGRFHNAGQVCLAAKRFILVEKIADEFEHLFVEAAKSIRVGDPSTPKCRWDRWLVPTSATPYINR
jgi:delta 1-pyrroline-5-carboxylate dehydrogenase